MSTRTRQHGNQQAQPPVVALRNQLMSPGTAEQLRMALPGHISVEKFQRVAITAVNRNRALVDADRQSLLTACVACAQDGLLPDGKEAALVMFGKDATYMPMIGGIYKRARNSGDIASINSRVVYAGDEFEYRYGFDQTLDHIPDMDSQQRTDNDIRYVYATVEMKDGTRDFEVMNRAEVEQVRNVSRAKNNGPWVGWWGEMAKKTVIRRLAKRLPMTSDLEKLVTHVDGMYDFGERGEAKDITPAPPPPRRADFIEPPARPEIDTDAVIDADAESEPDSGLTFVDENGEEHDCADPTEFTDAYAEHLQNLQSLEALEGVWDSNTVQINDLRENHAQTADELTRVFMACRAKLLPADAEPGA